jgi:hypothetical protein
LLPFGGLLEHDVPTLTLPGINGDFVGNYHIMDEESTEGMVILPGIARSLMRNPPEECLFRRELPHKGRGFHQMNGIPL